MSQKYEAEYDAEKERISSEKKKTLIFSGIVFILNIFLILVLLIRYYA